MKKVDLHTHSLYSDGTFSPKEIVEYACKKGLSAIALTDHDTLGGLDEACSWGERYGIEVIRGIEISTDYEGTEVHIVGLFMKDDSEELNDTLESLRKSREKRNIEMVKKLNDMGISIDYNDIVKRAGGGLVTRAHIAGELIDKGYASYNGEVFDRYIGKDKPAYVKRKVLPWKDALRLITSGGGIAVLAHPLLYKVSQRRLEEIISVFAKGGLSGIEAYYSTHTPSDVNYIKELAAKYKLKLSGGSDFHGKNKPKIDLGSGYGKLEVPYTVLEGLKKEHNIRMKKLKGEQNA